MPSIEVCQRGFLAAFSNLFIFSGESPISRSSDIHAVCDLVKSWFRVLPEPVFPSSSYHDIIQAMSEAILAINDLNF